MEVEGSQDGLQPTDGFTIFFSLSSTDGLRAFLKKSSTRGQSLIRMKLRRVGMPFSRGRRRNERLTSSISIPSFGICAFADLKNRVVPLLVGSLMDTKSVSSTQHIYISH